MSQQLEKYSSASINNNCILKTIWDNGYFIPRNAIKLYVSGSEVCISNTGYNNKLLKIRQSLRYESAFVTVEAWDVPLLHTSGLARVSECFYVGRSCDEELQSLGDVNASHLNLKRPPRSMTPLLFLFICTGVWFCIFQCHEKYVLINTLSQINYLQTKISAYGCLHFKRHSV